MASVVEELPEYSSPTKRRRLADDKVALGPRAEDKLDRMAPSSRPGRPADELEGIYPGSICVRFGGRGNMADPRGARARPGRLERKTQAAALARRHDTSERARVTQVDPGGRLRARLGFARF